MHKVLEIITGTQPQDYIKSLEYMRARAELIAEGEAYETLWLLEYNHLYTAGNTAGVEDFYDVELQDRARAVYNSVSSDSGNGIQTTRCSEGVKADLATTKPFIKEQSLMTRTWPNNNLAAAEKSVVRSETKPPIPIYYCDRGGQVTYHGPGQRVVYLLLNLRSIYGQNPDIRDFIGRIQAWVAQALVQFRVKAANPEQPLPGVGIWVEGSTGELSKIGAIGLKIRRGVTYHGIAININTDLSYFNKIKACAIENCSHISLQTLKNRNISLQEFDTALIEAFPAIFHEYQNYRRDLRHI